MRRNFNRENRETLPASNDGQWSATTVGTPQGSVISPLLANIYLHYVLDLWIKQWREKHAKGDVVVIRYADDIVFGFTERINAERFLASLHERFAKFGLALHPEKTRLIEFGRFASERRRERGDGEPETFDFLGFTHRCGTTKTKGMVYGRAHNDCKTHASDAG